MITADTLYAAYGKSTDYKNFLGQPMPKWEDLPPAIQDAWDAVAKVANKESDNNFFKRLTLTQWKQGATDAIEYINCRDSTRKQEMEENSALRNNKAYKEGWAAIFSIDEVARRVTTSC